MQVLCEIYFRSLGRRKDGTNQGLWSSSRLLGHSHSHKFMVAMGSVAPLRGVEAINEFAYRMVSYVQCLNTLLCFVYNSVGDIVDY